MTPISIAPDLANVLGGVLRLDGGAFVQALALQLGPWVALAIVVGAGLSEAVGQSIVLFANRVKPARFALSIVVDGALFTFGYAFLVLSTWAVCRLPGTPKFGLADLALVLAISYVPMLFAFLCALPYLGSGLMRVLRIWHFIAMVVGISATGSVDVFAAATYVGLGWLVMVVAQRSFGKPIVAFGTRLLDAAAGVPVVDDAQLVVGRMETGAGAAPATADVAIDATAARNPRGWMVALGVVAIVLLTMMVGFALEPLRRGMVGWQSHWPAVTRVPLNLLWLIIVAIVVSAFMAPFETLGWWAGWFGDDVDTSVPGPSGGDASGVERYIVYLDGIAQSGARYTPDIETFLDALSPELPPTMRLVRGVMAYSVINKPLDDDPIFSNFWKFVEAVRLKNVDALLGMFINLRNVLIVAVSADPRYGPMYNYGIATVIYRSLIANGYARNGGVPVTLIGYSGGGQMSCGAAAFLKRAIDAPVDVISLGGVVSGNDPILELEHLYHLVGTKDNVERIGPVMFASRWAVAPLSYWNRAKRMGALTEISLGPVGHQVPGGMLDPVARLPDGRTNLRQTLDYIESIITGRFVAVNEPVRKPNNYSRYAARDAIVGMPQPPATLPAGYLPVADWIGRLVLPQRDARFGGALFEVRHAPEAHRELTGKTVRLCWSDDPGVRDRLRAVTHDVNFSAEARSAAIYGGLVMPLRLDRWRLVDPLESLAGARPNDDVVVKLVQDVAVEEADGIVTLRVTRQPVQVTGTYYALLSFRGPAAGTDDGFRAVHYDVRARAFTGDDEIVRMPPVAEDLYGCANSTATGIDRSPLNGEGWYAYGDFDVSGKFVIGALAPRAALRAQRGSLPDGKASYRYARHDVWPGLTGAPGAVVADGDRTWRAGDAALIVHTYGGIGGRKREPSARGPVYFGHFAYGIARVIDDPIADEPRFEVTYYQVYTQNVDGLVAGPMDWSRYLGDRQYGWLGVRPVVDAAIACEEFDPALGAVALQLEVMTARYRIGDGTGGTFVGAANNCSQDSNRALFAALEPWHERSPLARDLRRQLVPFGTPRRDWSDNEFDLGTTMDDAPIANLVTAIGSWRCILPRLAFNTVVRTFARHGGGLRVVGTNHCGGERTDVEPVVPLAL